jgi:LysM repeat protein
VGSLPNFARFLAICVQVFHTGVQVVHRSHRIALLAALLGVGLPVPSADAHERAEHVVTPGETLWAIAKSSGCSVNELRKVNDMKRDEPLVVGARLQVPVCASRSSGAAATGLVRVQVRPGDTLSHLAKRHDTTVADLKARNQLEGDVIVAGQELLVAGREPLPLRVVTGQSVGRTGRGKLVDGVQLPRDPAYYRRRPHWAYGAQHVIDHTRRAIASVRDAFPSVHRLAIGDISTPAGGSIPGHKSHQSGRDIDIGLYFERTPEGYPEEFIPAAAGKLHLGATWALVQALWNASKLAGGPQVLFLDYDLQGKLYQHARKKGVSKKALREIFQYPDGRWAKERFVKHEPKHDDHIHVRYSCPPKDRTCK